MGSSANSLFLLPSLLACISPQILSGNMTLKVIIALSLVLVGLTEANPVSDEVTDVEPEDISDTIINGPESDETTEDDDDEEDVGTDYILERRKRSPRRKSNDRFGRSPRRKSNNRFGRSPKRI